MAKLFLRLTLGRRRTLWLGLALLIPVGMAVFWRLAEEGAGLDFFLQLVVNVILQFFTLGLCLYLGVAAVRDEIEDRTIVYLFARPVHRAVILGGKILAVFAVVCLAMSLVTVAIYFIALSADGLAATGQSLGRLGASLALYPLFGDVPPALVLSALKLLVHPTLVWVLAVPVFGLEGIWVAVAVSMAAMPSGINVYLFGARYEAAPGVAAGGP